MKSPTICNIHSQMVGDFIVDPEGGGRELCAARRVFKQPVALNPPLRYFGALVCWPRMGTFTAPL